MAVITYHDLLFFRSSLSLGVGSFADVAFAVDRYMKKHSLMKVSNLIAGALDQYSVSPTNTRVALVQYGDSIDVLHEFPVTDKAEFHAKLKLLSTGRRNRDIPGSLRELASKVFQNRPRDGIKQKIFMFVTGPTDEVDKVQVDVAASELRRKNIEVQFVYIGDHSSKSLLPLVKDANDIMHFTSSNEIAFAVNPVLRMKGVPQGKTFTYLVISRSFLVHFILIFHQSSLLFSIPVFCLLFWLLFFSC